MVKLIPFIKGYDVFNVGAGESYSVKEAIDIIQNELGVHKKVIEKYAERKNEVMDCVADVSHLESRIGKLAITSLVEGIHKWHLEDKK